MLSFCFLCGTLTSLLDNELLVVLWTDILVFSLHVKLLLNCFTMCEDLSHSLFFVVWYMPLECLHSGLGLTFSYAFLIHIDVWIWFRQFCSDEPIARWAYLGLFPLIALFEPHTLSLFYNSLQALSLKNHDTPCLRKFWIFGIVLGICVIF